MVCREAIHRNHTRYHGCNPSETFCLALIVPTTSPCPLSSHSASVTPRSFRLNPLTTTYSKCSVRSFSAESAGKTCITRRLPSGYHSERSISSSVPIKPTIFILEGKIDLISHKG